MIKAHFLLPLSLAVGLLSHQSVIASLWIGNEGDWKSSSNWSDAAVPTHFDLIQLGNGGQINVTDAQAGNDLQIGSTANTPTVNNRLEIATTGTLTFNRTSSIGYRLNSRGTLTVKGKLVAGQDDIMLFVGTGGEGALAVIAGGEAQLGRVTVGASPSGTGTVQVSGSMGTAGDLVVGDMGIGRLTIESGGEVTSDGIISMANGSGSLGTALVRGTLHSKGGHLSVSGAGTGVLTIGAGGTVMAKNGLGLITLFGASGTVNIGGAVSEGTPGTAEAAGIVNAVEVQGRDSGGVSILNFNHTGTDYHFTKTGSDEGAAVVISGAVTKVNAYAGVTVLNGANRYGGGTTITGSTAKIIAAHRTALGTGAIEVKDDGVLEIAEGVSAANAISLDKGILYLVGGRVAGAVQFSGTGGAIIGTGTMASALTLTSGNTLRVGGDDGIGTLTFGNSLTLAEGSISLFEVKALTSGAFDIVSGIGQNVAFGGALNVNFLEGFDTAGSIQLFDFESYFGSFSAMTFNGLAEGYGASFDSSSGILSVSAIPEPSTWALLSLSLAMAAMRFRRSLARNAPLRGACHAGEPGVRVNGV